MALSEEEQRLLDELEASLAADDPRLAQRLGTKTSYQVHRRRAGLAGLVFILGISGLIAGVLFTQWIIGLLGFVAMFTATVLAIMSWQKVDKAVEDTKNSKTRTPGSIHRSDPFGNLDERWRRRQRGDL